MNKSKKTMYEILEVSPKATDSEIQAAYQRLSHQLHSQQTVSARDDVAFKLKLVNVAFNTLSVKRTRDAYDARLSARAAPPGVAGALSLVPVEPASEAASLKAEAMSLKADAMSLKADAVALKADALSLTFGGGIQSPSAGGAGAFSGLLSSLKRILLTLGGLAALGMVVQLIFMVLVERHTERNASETAKAEEQLVIQEYYQKYGVRVGSKIEAELLDEQRRREEKAARERQEQERKYEQFVDQSRRDGERISADLRMAEQQARYEEERQKRQQEEEQRRKEEEENRRIEREQEKWRRVLAR